MRTMLALALAALGTVLAAQGQGQGGAGDLMVMPTRVVLEGRDRSAEVYLRNTGPEPYTYRISFQELRMLPSGEVVEIDKAPGSVTAADLVRFTPRQVELGPGETQTVRIQVRKPEHLPDGEYRSHLVFEGLPPVEAAEPVGPDSEERAVTFDIRMMISLSIPVIVRQGETHVVVGLSNLAFHPGRGPGTPPSLDLTLARTGNRSVQGEIRVDWQPESGRPVTLLPQAGQVVYTDVAELPVHLELPKAEGLAKGSLKVTFSYLDLKRPPVVATLPLP